MQFQGEERFSVNQADLFGRLTDLDFMAQTVPGLQRIELSEPKHLVCRVRPGFAFMAGTLKLTFDIVDEQSAQSLRYRVHGKGIGASVVVETQINLSADGSETKLAWQSEIMERGGLLKPVGKSLIQGAANKITADAWAAFRKALEEASGSQ